MVYPETIGSAATGNYNETGSAANRTRTCDMLVNSQPLYQLSYGGTGTVALYTLD